MNIVKQLKRQAEEAVIFLYGRSCGIEQLRVFKDCENIVEKLRRQADECEAGEIVYSHTIFLEAADEIERLRANIQTGGTIMRYIRLEYISKGFWFWEREIIRVSYVQRSNSASSEDTLMEIGISDAYHTCISKSIASEWAQLLAVKAGEYLSEDVLVYENSRFIGLYDRKKGRWDWN